MTAARLLLAALAAAVAFSTPVRIGGGLLLVASAAMAGETDDHDDGGKDDGGSEDGGSDDGGSDDGGSDDGGSDDGGSDDGGSDDGGTAVRAGRSSALSIPAARADGQPAYAVGELVARGLSVRGVERLRAKGYRLIGTGGRDLGGTVYRLATPRGVSTAEASRAVRDADAHALVVPNTYYYTDGAGPACKGRGCAAPALVGWSAALSRRCGPLPLIGLVDTGIDRRNPALAGQAIDVATDRGGAGTASGTDHGTAVAALLVGRPGSATPGLLPGARLAAVDAFYRDGGTADRTDVATLVNGIETLVNRGVSVINLSLSGPPNPVLEAALKAAMARDVVIVAAAGNGGAGAEPAYPAAYEGVIAVTAVDGKGEVYAHANRGAYVDFAAPGVDLWTAGPKGKAKARSGTSFAVPFVTAAAALERAAHPGEPAATLAGVLAAGAADLGEPGRDPVFGDGLVRLDGLCRSAAAGDADTVAAAGRPMFTPAGGN